MFSSSCSMIWYIYWLSRSITGIVPAVEERQHGPALEAPLLVLDRLEGSAPRWVQCAPHYWSASGSHSRITRCSSHGRCSSPGRYLSMSLI
eukprot:10115386-Heterocapsa_arctica.AAC.1